MPYSDIDSCLFEMQRERLNRKCQMCEKTLFTPTEALSPYCVRSKKYCDACRRPACYAVRQKMLPRTLLALYKAQNGACSLCAETSPLSDMRLVLKVLVCSPCKELTSSRASQA
jgi:hypothetical protein